MPTYQLQIKQVVDYPRCRIYRQFVRFLMEDRSIRVSGGSGLFYFTVLCSYANFRTSYRRIDGISYTVYPGEWVCTLKELSQWFRTRFQCQALAVLERLQKQHLISFQTLGRGNVVRYKICDWARHNTVLEYNAPCQKDTGFFFLPVSVATDLISSDRCSEMDIVLDLWVSAIYNDNQVQGIRPGASGLFPQRHRQSPCYLHRAGYPLGAVPGDSRPCPEKAGRAGLSLPHVLPWPAWQRDLSAKISVHHVRDFGCDGGQRGGRYDA